MANDITVEEIRDLVEDEIDLAAKEIADALAILRRIKKQLERTGDDPDKLALVLALIQFLSRKMTRLGEISLAKLGESRKVQGAIATLKQERKKLDQQVDAGLENAENLKTAQEAAHGLGKAIDQIARLNKPPN